MFDELYNEKYLIGCLVKIKKHKEKKITGKVEIGEIKI